MVDISGCPKCSSTHVIMENTHLYTTYWSCDNCLHKFEKHMTWRPKRDKPKSNVVRMIPAIKKPVERQLIYQIGMYSLQLDMTAHESACLNLFIFRSRSSQPMYLDDIEPYGPGVLRHLEIMNEDGAFVRGDKFLTDYLKTRNA